MHKPDALTKASEGYAKIKRCCEQAKQDGYSWAWVDTCCIDKRSSAELSEAINSMYRYYWNASKCYAYLSDVSATGSVPMEPNVELDADISRRKRRWRNMPFRNLKADASARRPSLLRIPTSLQSPDRTPCSYPEEEVPITCSRWFERGWTLQELLAPVVVEFYDKHWIFLGTKSSLANKIQEITGISVRYILDRSSISTASIGLRFSWASNRRTTRDEDIAYCLLGIVGVNMPLLYGEGRRAFRRLQVELLKQTRDHTVFAWSGRWWISISVRDTTGEKYFLAPSPMYFSTFNLEDVRPTFRQPLAQASIQEMTALGVHIMLPCIQRPHGETVAVLDCLKENSKHMGILLLKQDDGRYQKLRTDGPVYLSPGEVKLAVTQELYILDENLKDEDVVEPSPCAFQLDSLTIEGIPESDVCMYIADKYPYMNKYAVRQLAKNTHTLCDRVFDLSDLDVISFTIKLRSVNITILGGDYDGRPWLRVVLSNAILTRKETAELIQGFRERLESEHLRDYVMASRGTEIVVEVQARKSLLDRRSRNVICWHLAIRICAGSAMSR